MNQTTRTAFREAPTPLGVTTKAQLDEIVVLRLVREPI